MKCKTKRLLIKKYPVKNFTEPDVIMRIGIERRGFFLTIGLLENSQAVLKQGVTAKNMSWKGAIEFENPLDLKKLLSLKRDGYVRIGDGHYTTSDWISEKELDVEDKKTLQKPLEKALRTINHPLITMPDDIERSVEFGTFQEYQKLINVVQTFCSKYRLPKFVISLTDDPNKATVKTNNPKLKEVIEAINMIYKPKGQSYIADIYSKKKEKYRAYESIIFTKNLDELLIARQRIEAKDTLKKIMIKAQKNTIIIDEIFSER